MVKRREDDETSRYIYKKKKREKFPDVIYYTPKSRTTIEKFMFHSKLERKLYVNLCARSTKSRMTRLSYNVGV